MDTSCSLFADISMRNSRVKTQPVEGQTLLRPNAMPHVSEPAYEVAIAALEIALTAEEEGDILDELPPTQEPIDTQAKESTPK